MEPSSSNGEGSGLTLRIKFKSITPEQFVERYGGDLSSGGIFIRSREPLPVGTALNFAFTYNVGAPLLVGTGTVVWVREADPNKPGGGHPGMGIRFDKLTSESQATLARLLAEKARLERSGGSMGSATNPRTKTPPPPTTLPGSSGARDDAAPTPIAAEPTARVVLNPITGEPIARLTGHGVDPQGEAAAAEVEAHRRQSEVPQEPGTERSRTLTPFLRPPGSAARQPEGEPASGEASRRPTVKPDAPRRPTPAFGEAPTPTRRPTMATPTGGAPRPTGSVPVQSDLGRRLTPVLGTGAPPRRPTPAIGSGGAAVPPLVPRRPTLNPDASGPVGTPRRPADPSAGGAPKGRPTPSPGETRASAITEPGARWLPVDRVLSPLEGALTSTAKDAETVGPSAVGGGRGRTVERLKPPPGEGFDNEATEIARVPPEFMTDGAVPTTAKSREGSSGSSNDSRPTSPELRVLGGDKNAAAESVPELEALESLDDSTEVAAAPSPASPFPAAPSAPVSSAHWFDDAVPPAAPAQPPVLVPGRIQDQAHTGDLSADASTPLWPAPAPPSRRSSGGSKVVAAVIGVVLLAGGAYFFTQKGAPPPAAEPAPAAPAPAAANREAAPTVLPTPSREPPDPDPDPEPEAPPAAAAKAEEPAPAAKPAAKPAPAPVKRPVVAAKAVAKPAAEPKPAPEPKPAAETATPAPTPAAAPEGEAAATPAEGEVFWLLVRSNPPGADVSIDGAVEGKTPFQRRVLDPTRPYSVVVQKEGFESYERVVGPSDTWLKKGNQRSLVVSTKLTRSKAAPAAAPEGEAPAPKPADEAAPAPAAAEPAPSP